MKRFLVLCTANRCRSQMADGWLSYLGGDAVEVRSAGVAPNTVHPMAVRVMAEVGVDIAGASSDHVDLYKDQTFDAVVTVCDHAKETCPVLPGAGRVIHHAFDDPDDKTGTKTEDELLPVFRRVRNEIHAWARDFLAEQGVEVVREVSLSKG
ncbi:MAG: arsenate reductase ArsC [Planctomycetota bacterium]